MRGATVLWLLWALFIVYATTLPFRFEHDLSAAWVKLAGVPLNPFAGPGGRRASISDMTQNVLLFVPFGILGVLALRRHGHLARGVAAVTLTGAALSAGAETLQLFTVNRIPSTNDVLTNTAGALAGATAVAAARAVLQGAHVALPSLRALVHGPAYPTLVAVLLLAVAAWHPFDPALNVSVTAGKVRALVRDLWQVGTVADEGVDFLRYALFSGAAAMWLRTTGARHVPAVAALAGIALAVTFELSQLVVLSRMPGLKDVLVGSAGAVLGAIAGAGAHTLPRVAIAVLVIVAAVLGAAVMMLSPFTLASSRQPFSWMPFLGYYQYTSGQTVSHVLELALAFFPIGFAIAAVSQGSAVWLRTALVAVSCAALLEYAQGGIAGRYPDITDVMMLVLGACAGAWACRRRRSLSAP